MFRLLALISLLLTPAEKMVEVARSYLGTPYASSSIERVPETLVVRKDSTDCMLFVELCLATVISEEENRDAVVSEALSDAVRTLRYRGGVVRGYSSRIHYFSEWLQQGRHLGILDEYTHKAGESFFQQFNYMSRHPSSYPRLAPALSGDVEALGTLKEIRRVERVLEASNPYYRIPMSSVGPDGSIAGSRHRIQPGDILCFVSRAEGLDIAHVGIACPLPDGRMSFIHASSRAGKVILEPRALCDYPAAGLRVARIRNKQNFL